MGGLRDKSVGQGSQVRGISWCFRTLIGGCLEIFRGRSIAYKGSDMGRSFSVISAFVTNHWTVLSVKSIFPNHYQLLLSSVIHLKIAPVIIPVIPIRH